MGITNIIKFTNYVVIFSIVFFIIYLQLPYLENKLAILKEELDLSTNIVKIYIRFNQTIFPEVVSEGLEFKGIEENKQLVDKGGNSSLEKLNSRLSIPSLDIYGRVVDGTNDDSMNRGFWHYPNGGSVEKGNLVIIGHRFLKIPPEKETFYNLTKIKLGERIMLETSLGTWIYVVKKAEVVSKDSIDLLSNSERHKLTLITCHPLWTDKERFVVVADLFEKGVQR